MPKEKRNGKVQVNVSTSFFVPKPFTPFQWAGMYREEDFVEKAKVVKSEIRAQLNQRSIRYSWHEPDVTILEGFLARGDRRCSKVILRAYEKGAIYDAWSESFDYNIWKESFAETNTDIDFYTLRERSTDEILPWDFIDAGVTKKFLIHEWEQAKKETVTPNCRQKCSGCGAMRYGGGMSYLYVMKVRIKFSKEGPVKFVGHLDTMRYFQKAIRRANLPVAFSGGYSPHMIMSFAAPLGVGTESLGEYFDLELAETVPTSEITRRLDAVMVEGVHVLSTRQVEDGKAGKAMSLVAAADYYVEFRPGKEPEISWKDKISDFLAQPEITVMKKTKRSEKEIDIRPFIYKMELQGDKIFMMLASASANYTKPELVTDTFFSWLGIELPEFAYSIKRLEVYADKGTDEEHKFVTLEALGEEVE